MGRFVPACLAILAIPVVSFADPLQCIPRQASFVAKIETPRALIEGGLKHDAWRQLQAFPDVKEALDSTQVRRLLQLLAFIETETKSKWPDLIDKVAGNGVAIGFKLGDNPVPTLAVMEGRDEATVAKFFHIVIDGVKDQTIRDGKLKVVEGEYRGASTLALGEEAYLARHGSFIFFANKRVALEAGLQLAHPDTGDKFESILKHPTLPKGREMVGKHAAAWFWFDLAAAKATKEGKDFFENSRKELFQLLIQGSTIDAARRSDFLCAGLYFKPDGYDFSLRMPAKRADLDKVMRLHVPVAGDGARPLLEPEGVVFSLSFYLDLAHLWTNRKEIIRDENQLKEIEKGANDISRILPGTTFGKILEQSGPHHRIVMAQTGEKLYSKIPGQPIPPTAYVASIKDPQLNASLDGILRAAGLFAGFQTGWKISEETVEGVKIVSYKFPEADAKFEDEDNLRFNAAPSFALVEGSLIVGSTPGIVKRVIPLLKSEAGGMREVWKLKAYAPGGAAVLAAHPDAGITETILTQGVTLAEARRQMLDFSDWLKKLGTVALSIDHSEEFYRFDLTWTYGK